MRDLHSPANIGSVGCSLLTSMTHNSNRRTKYSLPPNMNNVNKRKSVIWSISLENLQNMFDRHHSFTDILKELGFDAYTGNHRTLKSRITEDKIDLTKFNENKTNYLNTSTFKNAKSFDDIFCENSTYNCRHEIKRKLIKLNILEYKCAICSNDGTHFGQPLSLQLDHLNGISTDNRICNLRLLCPNCHSQTNTFSGKRHKKYYKCPICQSPIQGKSTKCKKCENFSRRGKNVLDWPPVEEVISMVRSSSFLQTGKRLNRSDNAIRKFLKRNGINLSTIK